jgi:hypothetical protein
MRHYSKKGMHGPTIAVFYSKVHLCSSYMAQQADPDKKKAPNEMVACHRVRVNEK